MPNLVSSWKIFGTAGTEAIFAELGQFSAKSVRVRTLRSLSGHLHSPT